jgi:hypothetical protein
MDIPINLVRNTSVKISILGRFELTFLVNTPYEQKFIFNTVHRFQQSSFNRSYNLFLAYFTVFQGVFMFKQCQMNLYWYGGRASFGHCDVNQRQFCAFTETKVTVIALLCSLLIQHGLLCRFVAFWLQSKTFGNEKWGITNHAFAISAPSAVCWHAVVLASCCLCEPRVALRKCKHRGEISSSPKELLISFYTSLILITTTYCIRLFPLEVCTIIDTAVFDWW